jgi:flagellin
MGFRINNNISALVSQGNLLKTQRGVSQNIERLSSGLRINRGADDAAGLTISEKLRGQIRGLNRAISNSQDGISLIQTAEGALNENASILNRLRELTIQSQEDALTANDRLEIQKEVDQLVDEIDRISSTTEFNTKKLLDGTANALVSTNAQGLVAYQTGAAGSLSAGDYKVQLALSEQGVRQVQHSAILTNKDSGSVAGLSTQLKDLGSMYDNSGNSILDKPTTITLRGNGEKTDITVSSDMTLQQFADSIESAIVTSVADGGLGLKGSTFAFNAQSGQIVFESGKTGTMGELAISAGEDLLKSFGFQVTTESQAAAYKVSATTQNTLNPTSTYTNTTTDRATGVIEGLDLKFELATQARIDGSVAAQEVITIGEDAVVFTFSDTNRGNTNGLTQSGVVTITLSANRTFSLGSIESIINDSINGDGTDYFATNPLTSDGSTASTDSPAISARFDGYDLVLSSSHTGTSAKVSIVANQAATDILGLRTGTTSGTAGTAAIMGGSIDVSAGVTIGTTDLVITMADGDRNIAEDITFVADSEVSAVSLVDTFNNFFNENNVEAKALINADGKLEFQSTETGGDARISISATTGNLATLGFISGQNVVGSGGNNAVLTGSTHDSSKTVGYVFDHAMNISITDKNGASSGAIHFYDPDGGTDPVAEADRFSFAISQASVSSVLNDSSINSTDVAFEFDAGGRLDFYTRSAGKDARIIISTGESDAAVDTRSYDLTVGRNALGINVSQAVQGDGQTEFDLHVANKSLTFQIGANQKQHLNFEIINTSSASLGLTGLDITNIPSATRALGAIDNAVQMISSERSKLGSLQNRMTSTMNNLNVTATNLQSTESLIRDVDVAVETVEFTRNQILMQAGTAQLAQSRGLSQSALQLLG